MNITHSPSHRRTQYPPVKAEAADAHGLDRVYLNTRTHYGWGAVRGRFRVREMWVGTPFDGDAKDKAEHYMVAINYHGMRLENAFNPIDMTLTTGVWPTTARQAWAVLGCQQRPTSR